MGVGVLVPVDPTVFLIIAFVVIVGGLCLGIAFESDTEKKVKYRFNSKSSVEWKKCKNCRKKVNKVAKNCPYCGYHFNDDLKK